MFHRNRTWCVEPIATPEALASSLATRSWCCCAGFAIGQYVFLNDATSADGAKEYAVLKKPTVAGEPYVQIESITASWMSEERLLEFICRTLAGENDQVDWATPVMPRLESAEEHERCHLCA